MGIDAAAAATLDNGLKDGTALAGIGIAEKQPVLFSKGSRPNRVFDQVIIDLNSATFEIDARQWPVGERIIDGLAKGAARQITAGLFEEDQSAVQALADRTALADAHSGAFVWTCLAAAQVLLEAVEMRNTLRAGGRGDLAQDPSATLRCLLARLVEVAS